jgi:NADH dehydrogenase [ubiquinone] 1 alpha subcomplex assembly factor 6
VETATVVDQVKSAEAGPALVAMRFQWWRDGLAALARGAEPPAHPVLAALAAVGRGDAGGAPRKLPAYHLKRIADAREGDALDPQPPLTLEGLERYADATAGSLLHLQLAAVGVASRDADHAASHMGKAVGIATLLRGTAFHAQRRRSYLPLDLCADHRRARRMRARV